MLTALILICSAAAIPNAQDCTRDTAIAVIRSPTEFGNPVTCLMHGQAYLAETSIGQELGTDDVVRIICTPTKNGDASTRALDSDSFWSAPVQDQPQPSAQQSRPLASDTGPSDAR